MKIKWTPSARITYIKTLAYLEEHWTDNEVNAFAQKVSEVLDLICESPFMYQQSKSYKNVRKGFITKHNALYYKIRPRKKELELLMFWDNRKDPKKRPY